MQVLDASVIYKWYADEDNSDKANKILEDYKSGKIEVSIPDLLILELSNALKFNPKITSSEINEIIDNIYALELNIIIPTIELIKSAVKLSYDYEITIYDAIYLALAKDLEFEFITADKKLYNKIEDVKFVKLLGNLT